MKKIASVILALTLVVFGIFASVAEEALKAFENLTGQSVSLADRKRELRRTCIWQT